jgi:hypothetical protein
MAGEEALDLWNVLNKSLNFNLNFTFKMWKKEIKIMVKEMELY